MNRSNKPEKSNKVINQITYDYNKLYTTLYTFKFTNTKLV